MQPAVLQRDALAMPLIRRVQRGRAQHAEVPQMRRRPVPALSAYPYDPGISSVPALDAGGELAGW